MSNEQRGDALTRLGKGQKRSRSVASHPRLTMTRAHSCPTRPG